MKGFDLSSSLGYYFSKSNNLFKSSFNRLLMKKGYRLNSDHWTVLIILKNNPGIRQTDIAVIMQRDQPAVTRMMDFLENEGIVSRKNDPRDRRAHNIFLTEDGEQMYVELLGVAEELNNKLLEGIDKKNVKLLRKTLSLLIERMMKTEPA